MFIVALDYMEHTSIKYFEDMQPLNSANMLYLKRAVEIPKLHR